jgi:hypothetical protein
MSWVGAGIFPANFREFHTSAKFVNSTLTLDAWSFWGLHHACNPEEGGVLRGLPKSRRLWVSAFLLALAAALATALGVVGLPLAEAAGSYDDDPPNEVLMKGATVLQKGRMGSRCWSYYDDGRPAGYCADTF